MLVPFFILSTEIKKNGFERELVRLTDYKLHHLKKKKKCCRCGCAELPAQRRILSFHTSDTEPLTSESADVGGTTSHTRSKIGKSHDRRCVEKARYIEENDYPLLISNKAVKIGSNKYAISNKISVYRYV